MARIFGINIPDDKRIGYALTKVHGVGMARSVSVLKTAGIDDMVKVSALSEADLKKIQEVIEKNFKVEGDLKEEVNLNIKRLREVGAYRGVRHMRGLPVRGQRTKSNSRTKKGKRKTVGALKKEDMMKQQSSK